MVARIFQRRVGMAFTGVLLAAFLAVPIGVIVSLSLQTSAQKYGWFPLVVDWSAYKRVLTDNELGIRDSIIWTVTLLCPITLAAGVFAVALFYRLRAADEEDRVRSRIVFLILSVSFMPAYAMYAAINQIFDLVVLPLDSSTAKLLIGYFAYGVASFSISLLLVASGRELTTHFQQLLLDSESRWVAFQYSYLRSRWFGVVAAFMLTFSILWNEFVLAIQLASPFRLPFAAKLAGAHGQHNVDFSLYAVGAVVSLGVFAIVAGAVSLAAIGLLQLAGLRQRINLGS